MASPHPPPQHRVRVADFGSIEQGDTRLSELPQQLCYGGRRYIHVVAIQSLVTMALLAVDSGFALKVSSAWRAHRWRDRKHYETTLLDRYRRDLRPGAPNAEVIAYGRRFLAFNSPHETGLAVDFRCHGLEARSASALWQRRTPLYGWLCENAGTFGWTPYHPEPWHWEHWIDPKQWAA